MANLNAKSQGKKVTRGEGKLGKLTSIPNLLRAVLIMSSVVDSLDTVIFL